MSTASTPTESSVGYSPEEIAEMRNIFNKYDKDGSGYLNAHEFTNALQLMGYKYNEMFVTEVLKLVFETKWETKQNNLVFEDFMDFMSEFEPVHYEVLDKIEAKLKQKNINDINIDDAQITNLLKYAQMKNGTLLLNEIEEHLDEIQMKDKEIPKTILSLPSNTELNQLTQIKNIQNAENIQNQEMKQEYIPNNKYILKMNNNELIDCLNRDTAFNTTMIRKECCDIIQSQRWNGNDLFQALTLNKIDEILLLFKNIQNYKYIIESVNNLNPLDINYKELQQHLAMIQKQIMPAHTAPELLQPLDVAQKKVSMERDPLLLNKMLSKDMMNEDDEQYVQNVWKQILEFFDENNDGTIDTKEMAPALRSLGIDVNDNKLMDTISKIDQDKSGTIDYCEFKTYYNSFFEEKMLCGLDLKYIKNMFSKYDVDSSGFLDSNEFRYVLKKLCVHITDKDSECILHFVDRSGDGAIEFEEFVGFLESDDKRAEWILKKLMRASIPTPTEYLVSFKGLPQHFRESELAEIAKHNSFKMSEWMKPTIDIDGITLNNIKMDPLTSQINPKYTHDVRIFKLTECSGVALPEAVIASRIMHRRMRVCLFSDNKAISNVFTIPVLWKPTEEDQWLFGSNVWKDSISNTLSEWNMFCVAIPQNLNTNIELCIELCIVLKQNDTMAEVEMSCGWSKLQLNGTTRAQTHKLKINGGTFKNESDISESDVRNDNKSNISFRKLKQALSRIQSVIQIEEQSYENIKNSHIKECLKWIPQYMITNVLSSKIIKLYYELMADYWFRNKQIFDLQFFSEQNLYQTLLLFIMDRANILCIFIDEWNTKYTSFWRSQKNDPQFICNEFKLLLQQFVPLLIHQETVQNPLYELNQQRLSFVKQITKGNMKQMLSGNKPSHSIPIIYAPFSTDLFV